MLYLSAADSATLKAFFATAPWSSYDAPTRFLKLHTATMVANPVTTAPQIPVPYTVSGVLAILSPASLANVHSLGYLDAIRTDINANDTPAVQVWNSLLLGAGSITLAEHDSIAALISKTEPDPSWQAQIPAGPTPAQTLFPGKTWKGSDGSTVDFITLDDVKAVS